MVTDPHRQEQSEKHHRENEQLRGVAELPLQDGRDAQFELAACEGCGDGVSTQQQQCGVVEDVAHAEVGGGLHFHGVTGVLGVLQHTCGYQ